MARLAFISDTHTQHRHLTTAIIEAKADVLVHCGDFTANEPHEKMDEISAFADWCEMLLRKGYVKHIVAIAGNHDEFFDPSCPDTRKRDDATISERCREKLKRAGVVYLQDSGQVVCGLVFWGTPWTGRFYDWAFQIDSRQQDADIFGSIPGRTEANVPIDVLVTHGPPYGVRDLVYRAEGRTEHSGSPGLLAALDRVKPRVCAFGHIHYWHGMTVMPNGVICINAASAPASGDPYMQRKRGQARRRLRDPIIVDLETRWPKEGES